MKIIYISNSRIPTEKAYGIQIMKMCEAFGLQKNDVELVLPTRKNKKFYAENDVASKNINIFNYYDIKNNFKIKKIKSFDPNFLMRLPDGIYIKFQLIFFSISLFFFLLFKKNKSSYIFYTRDEYLLPLLQKFSKKVVWEAHTLPKSTNKYLKYWADCHKIVSISQNLKNELVQLGIEENKIIVAHDGVELGNFRFPISNFQSLRKKLNLPQDKKIILYAGHLYDWKGAQILANASEFLSDDYEIIFIGGTDLDIQNFKQKNIRFIKDNKILILGHKEPKLIPEYLKSADVLVLPNSAKDNKSKWTSPLKLFEYMASGKPIISSDLPSIREVLDKNNSILFEPDNSQDLADKIKNILNNKKLAEKILQQALQDVQEYSWSKRADKILKFIKL